MLRISILIILAVQGLLLPNAFAQACDFGGYDLKTSSGSNGLIEIQLSLNPRDLDSVDITLNQVSSGVSLTPFIDQRVAQNGVVFFSKVPKGSYEIRLFKSGCHYVSSGTKVLNVLTIIRDERLNNL